MMFHQQDSWGIYLDPPSTHTIPIPWYIIYITIYLIIRDHFSTFTCTCTTFTVGEFYCYFMGYLEGLGTDNIT